MSFSTPYDERLTFIWKNSKILGHFKENYPGNAWMITANLEALKYVVGLKKIKLLMLV
jgi:hypothetical protein